MPEAVSVSTRCVLYLVNATDLQIYIVRGEVVGGWIKILRFLR